MKNVKNKLCYGHRNFDMEYFFRQISQHPTAIEMTFNRNICFRIEDLIVDELYEKC